MPNTMITIEGEQVDFLKALPGEFDYKPVKIDDSGNEIVNTESPLFNKKYRRFAYGDKVFIANTEDEFCKMYDDEQLWKVMFSINEAEQYSLVKGVSIKRAIATANTTSTIKKIYREAETSAVDADLLNALQNS